MSSDPTQAGRHSSPDCIIIHPQGNGYPHPASRRIDSQMQVLDALPDYVNRNPMDDDPLTLNTHSDS
jgi:hypothetical protein